MGCSNSSSVNDSKPKEKEQEQKANEIIITVQKDERNKVLGTSFLPFDQKKLNESNTEIYFNNEKQQKFTKTIKYEYPANIIEVKLKFLTKIIDCKKMFAGCAFIKKIDLTSFDCENIVSLESIFTHLPGLESVNLKNLDTRNVTNMKSMFYSCQKLTEVDLSDLNADKVDNISCMFKYCENLKSVKLPSFALNFTSYERIKELFLQCPNLENLNFKYLNLQNVKEIHDLFDSKKLKTLDLSNVIFPESCEKFEILSNLKNLEEIILDKNKNNKLILENIEKEGIEIKITYI